MIKNLHYAAFAALILMPLCATAQEETGSDDEDHNREFVGPGEQVVPVAEEEITDEYQSSEPETPDSDASEASLLEEFARYRRLVEEGTLDEADIAAKRIVEMAIKIYGPQSRETASALNNLGIVQYSTGQFDAAIQNFTSAIEIIEIVEDRLDSALINPLKGLGAAQLSNGRPDQARETYTRATHISHVNEGPHNLQQVEILESIAETYIRTGDVDEARDTLDRIHALNVKHFEEDPLGLLPSLMNRAAWQHRVGYYTDERMSYRRAIRIIEAGGGKNDPLLVEPLRRLGESFYYLDTVDTPTQQMGRIATGEMYFKRAVRIAEKSEGFDWADLARTQIALADYYTYTDTQNRAQKMYRAIWDQMSVDEERMALRNEWFRDPVPIWTESLPNYSSGVGAGERSSRKDLIAGSVVVDFTVSERGRVQGLVSEAFPPEFANIQAIVHREIRQRVYRPRLVDGVAVEAADLRFEHPFAYLQSDLDGLRAAATSSANEETATDEEPQEADSD
ncbi:MAG: tetratricopeptide repeat protein [Woeseiaceae bacterium]|nr:tetratricopeptide repeat protein [Woeseiaceae bacterium]